MSNLIGALFPQGQRKLVVSLIALIVGVVIEKTQGGLSEAAKESLIAIVAIFTGGNVLEHVTSVFKKPALVAPIMQDFDEAEDLSEPPVPLNDVETLKNETGNRFNAMEEKINIQSQNISQIVTILNQMRNPQPPKGP